MFQMQFNIWILTIPGREPMASTSVSLLEMNELYGQLEGPHVRSFVPAARAAVWQWRPGRL